MEQFKMIFWSMCGTIFLFHFLKNKVKLVIMIIFLFRWNKKNSAKKSEKYGLDKNNRQY